MQLKIDELIRAVHGARNEMLNLEDLSDEEIEIVQKHYLGLAEKARVRLQHKSGMAPTGDHSHNDPDRVRPKVAG